MVLMSRAKLMKGGGGKEDVSEAGMLMANVKTQGVLVAL